MGPCEGTPLHGLFHDENLSEDRISVKELPMLLNGNYMLLKYILLAIGAYLIASINASIILSKGRAEGDVRNHGSGNAGATNMARIYGLRAGILALAVDALKALIAVLIGWWLLGDVGIAVAGIACLIGHCFPVYYHFKGGKGVSVGAAIGLAIDWRAFLVIVCVFFIFALLSKKVSLGSICAAVALTIASIAFHVSTPRLVLAVAATVLVVFQHRANIKRLIQGKEPDFKPAKK